jgi:hypothetical protein
LFLPWQTTRSGAEGLSCVATGNAALLLSNDLAEAGRAAME